MFVFKRKQFLLIFSFLFLSFSFYFVSNNTKNRNYDITQVSTIPVTNKVIIVDAGHGRRRPEELLIHQD